jgi:DnaK suppressor protein
MDRAVVAELLATEREETLSRIRSLSIDLEGIVDASLDANADDEHDPEGSTIAFERAQVTALLDGARASLDELDRALTRLAAGTYGTCATCGVAITPERLTARPATLTCVGCAAGSRHG